MNLQQIRKKYFPDKSCSKNDDALDKHRDTLHDIFPEQKISQPINITSYTQCYTLEQFQ